MLKHTVLVVDDDVSIQRTLEMIFKKEFKVLTASTGWEALDVVKKHDVDVLFLDIRLPGINGMDVLKKIKDAYMDIEVIMITAVKDVETAVMAMKFGAFDYITKDFEVEDLRARVWKVIEALQHKKELFYLKDKAEKPVDANMIIATSPKMMDIKKIVQKVSKVPTTILLLGESGTGKELIAKLIWKESGLTNAPFVPVNMASIPGELIESILFGHEKGAFTGAHQQHYGKFELANNGFLFLDEIGDLRLDLQAKLLRAIQEGEIERVGGTKSIKVDVRLIAATHANLEERVKKGEFREDLYYRINVVPIKLPPLRERLEDVPLLAEFFVEKYRKKFGKEHPRGITKEAVTILTRYKWAGNIRELENLMERLVAISDMPEVRGEDIPVEFQIGPEVDFEDEQDGKKNIYDNAVMVFEKKLILQTMEKANWSRKKSALMLGLSLSTLKYKLKHLGIYDILSRRKV